MSLPGPPDGDGDVEAKLGVVHLQLEARPQEFLRRQFCHHGDIKRGIEMKSVENITVSSSLLASLALNSSNLFIISSEAVHIVP